jgi:ribosomal protein S18 acetylase RimI-like enzyme
MLDTRPRQPINIRDAIVEDVDFIANLGAHVFTATFGHSVPPLELQAYLEEAYSTTATTKDVRDPNKDMIVATTPDNVIIGFALLTRGTSEPCIDHLDNKVELQRIYVHPDYHGLGIGTILANRIEAMAREQGFSRIWLGVWEENFNAQKVYEKLGYGMAGDHDFTIGEVVQTDHIMVKSL